MENKLLVPMLVLWGLKSGLTYSTDLSSLAQVKVNSTLLKILIDSEDNHNVSDSCRAALKQFQDGIATSEEWAIRMVDASAVAPSGVLEGSKVFLGSYDECLNTPTLFASNSSGIFSAHYCPVDLTPVQRNISDQVLLKSDYRWDLCAPSACTPQDLEAALFSISTSFIAKVSSCSVQTVRDFDTSELICLVILSLLASLLFSGTLLDVTIQIRQYLKTDENINLFAGTKPKSQMFFESFSLYTNACQLLVTSSGSGHLSALNGIRVLSTIWIMVGHCYILVAGPLIGNMKQLQYSVFFSFPFQVMTSYSVSVDTFFFISGLLVVYLNLKKLSKSSHINWLQFYFHRYWRLTPPVAFLILFVILQPRMGSGSNWSQVAAEAAFCRINWWTNLLYINSIYPVEQPCQGHCWYLADDMQFYILSPLVFYPMWRWPAFGHIMNGIFLLVSVVTPAVLSVTNGLMPVDNNAIYWETYHAPYCRMSPYCVGMALGYIISLKKKVS